MTLEEAIKILRAWTMSKYKPTHDVAELALAALDAIQRQGEFGRLFVAYKGCPRGPMGRSALPLEDEVLSMSVIEDVDGGRWIPVNADALRELVDRFRALKEQHGAQAEAEKNEPLTLEELREMEGEPVWVEMPFGYRFYDGWALVDVAWKAHNIVYLVYAHGLSDMCDNLLKSGGKIYRRKPEEE